MSEHTPGRIQLAKEFDGHIMTMDGLAVSDCCLDHSSLDHDQQVSNARRLVACWNACDGVPTELLEAYPAPFTELRAQRDELLAALKEARRWIGDGECSDGLAREHWTQEYRAAVDRIDAAIAKVEGGAA